MEWTETNTHMPIGQEHGLNTTRYTRKTGGVVHGVGMKGKVMDYQDIRVKDVKQILLYVKQNDRFF